MGPSAVTQAIGILNRHVQAAAGPAQSYSLPLATANLGNRADRPIADHRLTIRACSQRAWRKTTKSMLSDTFTIRQCFSDIMRDQRGRAIACAAEIVGVAPRHDGIQVKSVIRP